MPNGTPRLILAPALLIAALGSAACGAASPTAPAQMPAELGPGRYTLMVYGTATCLAGSGAGAGSVPSSAAVPVVLEAGSEAGIWRLVAPGQPLTGEVGLESGALQGFVRGTAMLSSVRFSTGELPDSTVAFQGGRAHGGYEGVVLAGTPRFEGVGAASGSATTCMSNGFTLERA